jgi:hypothetical protein
MVPASGFDGKKFKNHFPALLKECNNIYHTSRAAENALQLSQGNVKELLALIRPELASLKK